MSLMVTASYLCLDSGFTLAFFALHGQGKASKGRLLASWRHGPLGPLNPPMKIAKLKTRLIQLKMASLSFLPVT